MAWGMREFRIWCIAAGVFVGGTGVGAENPRVVGFYPSWNRSSYPHTAVAYQHLTHIAHAFIAPTVQGGLEIPGDFLYPALIQSAHTAGVKVVVSLGGWGEYSNRFSPMVADTAARRLFVENIKNFCLMHGYDGIDIDWEYPKNTADRANFTLLVSELRSAFNAVSPPLLLTMAGPSTNWSAQWFDLAAMVPDFDWIGIMTYDYYGSWTTKSGPNSALFGSFTTNTEGWVKYSVDYYNITRGVPKEKLLMGIPFYGWMFNASSLYGPSTGASQLTYTNIVPKTEQGWQRYWDATSLTPYLINAAQTQLISYDDSLSVTYKCQYLSGQGLGGTIIWAIGQDLVAGQQPLLGVIGSVLKPVVAVQPPTPANSPEEFRLYQNYPNPFNSSTTIEYTLPAAGAVSLRLFDLLGRELAVLIDAEQAPGRRSVRFDAGDLASGLYVYRLSTPWNSLTRMLTVLR